VNGAAPGQFGQGFAHIWVYLEASPLLGLTVTLLAYQIALWVYQRAGRRAIANPVLISVVLLVTLLLATGTPYAAYFDGAKFVHFLLGPATVALAVPLYANLKRLRRAAPAIGVAIVLGSITASGSAMAIAWALGARRVVILSLAPKSVTTPIAMGISEQIGGLPSLTAVLVILTGIIGAVCGAAVMRAARITDWRAHGLASGTAAHAIGTARTLMLNETAGAFAGLAIGVNGLITAIVVPLLIDLAARWF